MKKKINSLCGLLGLFSLVMLIIHILPNTNPIFSTLFWISILIQLPLRSAIFFNKE